MVWLGIYAVVQIARVYILGTLGRRWTTRIIVLIGEAKVTKGPFALIPHPNYPLVIAEILVAPLSCPACGRSRLIFGVLNTAVLVIRISAEEWPGRAGARADS